MKPVYQEIVEEGKGDCFSACLASLLEVELADVPKFARDFGPVNMMHEARNWLSQTHGLSIVTIAVPHPDDIQSGEEFVFHGLEYTPCIACVPSPNFPGGFHAVVGELDNLNYRQLHDPNKDGKPCVEPPKFLYFLVPMNPSVRNLRSINRELLIELTRQYVEHNECSCKDGWTCWKHIFEFNVQQYDGSK